MKHTSGPWVANDKHSDSNHIWRVESDANGYPNDGYIIATMDGPNLSQKEFHFIAQALKGAKAHNQNPTYETEEVSK